MTHNYYPGAIARSSPQTALDERDVSTLPTARMPAQTKTSSRVLYLDILRIVAMLAVICIHTTAGVLYDVSARKTLDWRAAMVLNAGSRWCVPMYVLLSGAFLLTYRRRYTSHEFIRSRLLRIGIPFLAWSIIYMIWSAMIVHQTHISTWIDVWNQLASPAYYHLWFFYMLIGLYLATPALSVLVAHASRPLLWSLVAVLLVGAAWATVAPLFTHLKNGFVSFFPLTSSDSYIAYFLLGYLLVSARFPRLWVRLLLYGLALVAVALTAYSAYHFSGKTLFYPLGNYTTLTTLVETLAIFYLSREIPWNRLVNWRWARRAINTLALSTFGVYLIHAMIKYYVDQQAVHYMALMSLRYQLLAPFVLFALSAIIIIPLRRIPIVNYLIP